MCIDNEGKIWVACFGASCVNRFDPETGKFYVVFVVCERVTVITHRIVL